MSWNEQEARVALRNSDTGEFAFNAVGLSVNSFTATVKALSMEVGKGAHVREVHDSDRLGPGAWFIIGPAPQEDEDMEDAIERQRPQG